MRERVHLGASGPPVRGSLGEAAGSWLNYITQGLPTHPHPHPPTYLLHTLPLFLYLPPLIYSNTIHFLLYFPHSTYSPVSPFLYRHPLYLYYHSLNLIHLFHLPVSHPHPPYLCLPSIFSTFPHQSLYTSLFPKSSPP